MWFKALFLMLVMGCVSATFKGGQRCHVRYQYVPKYVTEFEHVPHYETIYNTKYFPSPVPKVVVKTEYIDRLVTEDFYQTIYTTVAQPQYIPVTKFETVYTTDFVNQIVPQYVTKTAFQPQYVTHTHFHTVQVPVQNLVTDCPYDY